MPHKVASFFRSHTNPFEIQTDFKKGGRRLSPNKNSRPSPPVRSPSSSDSSLLSEERSIKMGPTENALKRLSGLHSPKNSSSKIPQLATLDMVIESPPIVFYGVVANSSGALLSGQLKVNVTEDVVAINSFKMSLVSEVVRKKPFHNHCPDCANRDTELNNWSFLQGPATLTKGQHSFPFSFLLPGKLPATMKGALASINYVLRATLTPKTGEPLKLSQVLDVKRAILPSDQPRNSIRIFPPTNLTASCQLPSVIHPIGENTLKMRMDGVVNRCSDGKSQTMWKLKRMTWRLEEKTSMVSPGCAKHVAKLGADVEEDRKKIIHTDTRTIGTDDIKDGWKSNFTDADGSIELEFPFGVHPGSKPVCAMKSPDMEVSHVLIVEMIVGEDLAPIKKLRQTTPTGAARVLRMHFNVVLTERSGMGIAWDEEQPPLYENIPASPPSYGHGEMTDYDGPPIPDYEDLLPLDQLGLSEGSAAPSRPTTSSSGGLSRRRLSISDLEQDALVPQRTHESGEVEDSGDVDGGVVETQRS